MLCDVISEMCEVSFTIQCYLRKANMLVLSKVHSKSRMTVNRAPNVFV